MNAPTLILASTSATRKRMLREAGISFDAVAPGVDEAALKRDFNDLSPVELVRALAKSKALSVARQHSQCRVVAADQILLFAGRILDKPEGRPGAIARLMDMRGKPHVLMTATVFYQGERCLFSTVDEATLTLKHLNHGEIRAYVDAERPWDSVGAYKIEGPGRDLFSQVNGEEDVIMGMNIRVIKDLVYGK